MSDLRGKLRERWERRSAEWWMEALIALVFLVLTITVITKAVVRQMNL